MHYRGILADRGESFQMRFGAHLRPGNCCCSRTRLATCTPGNSAGNMFPESRVRRAVKPIASASRRSSTVGRQLYLADRVRQAVAHPGRITKRSLTPAKRRMRILPSLHRNHCEIVNLQPRSLSILPSSGLLTCQSWQHRVGYAILGRNWRSGREENLDGTALVGHA